MRKFKILPVLSLFLVASLLPACQSKKNDSQSGGNSESSESQGSEVDDQEYMVTLNPCNGEAPTRVTGKPGTVVNLPQLNDYQGQPFTGWSTKYSSTRKMGDASAIVTSFKIGYQNQILYACYASQGITDYMNSLKQSSVNGHLYYHYYQYGFPS